MKKRFKHRLTGRKRKPDGTEVNTGGEGTDSASSLTRPESHIVADEGRGREGDRTNAAGEQIFSTDRPLQPGGPESVPPRGCDDGREQGEVDIDGGEGASQRCSHLHPGVDVDVAVGSGRGGELEGVDPSPSAPSISHDGKPDSTQTMIILVAASDSSL